jgi:hypothetical protein
MRKFTKALKTLGLLNAQSRKPEPLSQFMNYLFHNTGQSFVPVNTTGHNCLKVGWAKNGKRG